MFLLLLLIVLGLVLYFMSGSRDKNTGGSGVDAQLANRNREWAQFIAGYRAKVHSKTEKALVERMLKDIAAKGLPVPAAASEDSTVAAAKTFAAEQAQQTYEPAMPTRHARPAVNVQLDNASLLLYFGAFLFVASVGLFVAFGGGSGALRTFAVLLVSLVMYGAGMWLHDNRPKLQQAGLAFVGIGMASAPFIGLAAYTYMFDQSNGPAVWMGTSVLCLAMYLHALVALRKPLISYMLIFTFLSLFESGVSITAAPLYYFGWGMALVGIILSVVSRLKGFWPELQESSRMSAQVFLPISLFASIVLVSEQGVGQLGISLLLAAAFYGLEALSSRGTEQQSYAIVAHVTTIAGAVALAYANSESWTTVAWLLVGLNGLQTAFLAFSGRSALWRNYGTILVGTALLAIVPAWTLPQALVIAAAMLPLICLALWMVQERHDAYVLAMFSAVALPVIIGQFAVGQRLEATAQSLWVFAALLAQLVLYLGYRTHAPATWALVARQTYMVSSAAVVFASMFASPAVCLGLTVCVTMTLAVLAEYDRSRDWSLVAGLLLFLPIFRGSEDQKVLLFSLLAALVFNVFMALRHRSELNRWFSMGLWLALPLTLGNGVLGVEWQPLAYAWAYMIAMLVLVASRAIARGLLFVSHRVPVESYARHASMAYVVGYTFAAAASVTASLMAEGSRLHTTIILGIVAMTVYLLARYIERRTDILMLLPVIGQAMLWSAIRPDLEHDTLVTLFLLSSVGLAAFGYLLLMDLKTTWAHAIREGSLVGAFVAPITVLFVGESSWPMAFGLLVASGMLYHYVHQTNQANREWVGALGTAAIMWWMWIAGVHALQAYTHVAVAVLAGYAYWRTRRGETEQANQYLTAMLVTATVPLAIQAVSDVGVGVYGWWLLLEQVFFMLLGMAIGNHFVTRWGLYVAVAAVLYQLRGLGWAALAVLALFLIGLAVFQLQKINTKD